MLKNGHFEKEHLGYIMSKNKYVLYYVLEMGTDVKFRGIQMALNESRREIERMNSMDTVGQNTVPSSTLSQSAIDDLLSLGVGQPVEQTTPNPWGGPVADPWAPASGIAPATNVGWCFRNDSHFLFLTECVLF